MRSEDIQKALHAERVVPVTVANPHGPLGLEQLTAAVGKIPEAAVSVAGQDRVRRFIDVRLDTWEKLARMAQAKGQSGSRKVTASEVAVNILEQVLAAANE